MSTLSPPLDPPLSIVSILSSLDGSIQSQSIKDCFRLGKFSPSSSRPRPILIKFVRAADVASIFSKKRNLTHPYSIKPDMPRDQRLLESVLMKERWSLIQSGTSRKDIRIKGNFLYVHGKLHGRVSNLKFEHETHNDGASLVDHAISPRCNSPIVQQDQQSSHHVHTSPASDKSTTSTVVNTYPQHSPPVYANNNPTPALQISITSESHPNLHSPQS